MEAGFILNLTSAPPALITLPCCRLWAGSSVLTQGSAAAATDNNAGICSPVMSSRLASISKRSQTINDADSLQH